MTPKELFAKARLVFWDFDGVIKDSLEVKGTAFARLFNSASPELVLRILAHHAANGGMSRYEKIPLYMQWSGEVPTETKVLQLCKKMESLVTEAVVSSPWVPGVEVLLRNNPYGQMFVVVSATPLSELTFILKRLNLAKCFLAIYGAPASKADVIAIIMQDQHLAREDCLMIGDAQTDLDAARVNDVPFLLRRHDGNAEVMRDVEGLSINDFEHL